MKTVSMRIRSEINIAPYNDDILLVLLIIFMGILHTPPIQCPEEATWPIR